MNTTHGAVSFVCTKTDSQCMISELIRSLKIRCAEPLEEEPEKMECVRMDLDKQVDDLYSEVQKIDKGINVKIQELEASSRC